MGLLDGVLGQVAGQIGGNNQTMRMAQTIIGMVGGGGGGGGGAGGGLGGLGGLVQKLQDGGLGDAAKSWVGTGDNHDVTPDQVTAALGDDEVQRVADEAGVSKDEAAGGLAALLPSIIDKATPDGLVPDPESLARRLQDML